MTIHKHADILRAIADGVEVQFRHPRTGEWVSPLASENPISSPHFEWRIKPQCITVGKHSWPEPMKVAPADGTKYFLASPIEARWCLARAQLWDGMEADQIWLSRGICHLTAEAAEQHAQALIAISQGDI